MEIINEQNQAIVGEPKQYRYGGFWVRFIAHIIDGIVISFVQFGVSLAFGLNFLAISIDVQDIKDPSALWAIYGGSITLITLISVVIDVLYFAGMQSSAKQATIGKMAFNLKVVDTKGNRISFLRAIARYFSKILSGIIFMIGYIMAGFDSRKQALHDKLANTMVVYEANEENM